MVTERLKKTCMSTPSMVAFTMLLTDSSSGTISNCHGSVGLRRIRPSVLYGLIGSIYAVLQLVNLSRTLSRSSGAGS